MSRHLVYAHPGAFPSNAANTVNVAKMCAAFAGHGHRVTLVALGPDGEGARGDVSKFYDLANPVGVKLLPSRLTGLRTFAIAGAVVSRLIAADIVMTRMPRIGHAAAMLGLPVIVELHADIEWVGRQRPALEALSRSERLAALVVISEALAHHYAEVLPHIRDRIVVAHDGADPVPGTPARAVANDGRLRVGYTGHLYPGKGMEIIAALALLCPWADFDIVGGRPEDVAAWREKAAAISNLHFHGAVPHSEVNEWLARFDVVLAPYLRSVIVSDGRTDVARWMSPLKIFEYMAAAKAIVTSDLPVLREVLTDRETALLCDPDDPKAWAAALHELSLNPGLSARLGAAAQARFLNKFTWDKRAAAILRAVGT